MTPIDILPRTLLSTLLSTSPLSSSYTYRPFSLPHTPPSLPRPLILSLLPQTHTHKYHLSHQQNTASQYHLSHTKQPPPPPPYPPPYPLLQISLQHPCRNLSDSEGWLHEELSLPFKARRIRHPIQPFEVLRHRPLPLLRLSRLR